MIQSPLLKGRQQHGGGSMHVQLLKGWPLHTLPCAALSALAALMLCMLLCIRCHLAFGGLLLLGKRVWTHPAAVHAAGRNYVRQFS